MNNTDFHAQIDQLDQEQQLQKHFRGMHCGVKECETQCAEALKIAQKLNLEPIPFVQKFIADKIAPKYGCSMPADSTAETLEKMRCRFGFVRYENTILFDDNKSTVQYIFKVDVNECDKCKNLDKTVVTETQRHDEKFMQKLGFWKQKDGVYRPHPNCRCSWELVKDAQSTTKNLRPTVKNVADAVQYAVVETMGSQSLGIGYDVVKIGAEVITSPSIFAARIRVMILEYHKKDPTAALDDLNLLGKHLSRTNWKGMAQMYNKYKRLLSKKKN